MVSTEGSITEVVVRHRKYHWPGAQLNFWLVIMTVGASLNLGVFATFIGQQNQLQLGIPWYFPYWVTVGTISLIFMIIMYYLINARLLLPGVVLLGSLIMFILWLVGLIVISVQLWGENGVNSNCNVYVYGQQYKGQSVETLAWLQQRNICQSWEAAWAFELVGTIFLIWMMIMSYNVYRDEY